MSWAYFKTCRSERTWRPGPSSFVRQRVVLTLCCLSPSYQIVRTLIWVRSNMDTVLNTQQWALRSVWIGWASPRLDAMSYILRRSILWSMKRLPTSTNSVSREAACGLRPHQAIVSAVLQHYEMHETMGLMVRMKCISTSQLAYRYITLSLRVLTRLHTSCYEQKLLACRIHISLVLRGLPICC